MQQTSTPISYRSRLISELVVRQKRNPGYSLRSFARDLRVSPATLSQALNSKRNLSKRNLLKVAERLGFSPSDTKLALGEISNAAPLEDQTFTTLSDDVFRFISDWYYFAILSLASTGKAKANPKWLSARFGITSIQASDALDRLLRLRLISIEKELIVYDGKPLKITTDVPSSAARQLQHHHMRLAQESLERDPIHLRDMTSMTMAIDLSRIPKAKEMITIFRRKLTRYLEGNGKGKEVYVLALQLFPVTRGETS